MRTVMSDAPNVALSAFLDGEAVDTANVLAALETDEGRRELADFVRLRLLVSAGEEKPRPEFYARMAALTRSPRPVAISRRRWPLVAAVAASLVLGFWSGSAITSRTSEEPTSPPNAARVLAFQPGVDWQQTPAPMERVK
jgi:hypothetical protein